MDRQHQDPRGDDFLESLRRAAARPPAEPPSTGPDLVRAPGAERDGLARASTIASPGPADLLGDLEARMAEVEQQLRRLNEDRARLVSDVADAVVAKLDARWRHALGNEDVPS